MSFPRVNFWNSFTHRPSQDLKHRSLSQTKGSIEWILIEITKFSQQQTFELKWSILISFPPSINLTITQFTKSISSLSRRSNTEILTFPSLLTLSYSHCLVSSIANFLPSLLANFSFTRLWTSIDRFAGTVSSLVHFRFTSINRSFSQNLRFDSSSEVSFPREGRDRPARIIDKRSTLFASCRVSPGSYTLPNRERDIIRRDPRPLEFAGFNGARSRKG